MILARSTILDASADRAWQRVKRTDTLVRVARGLMGLSGAARFPAEWSEGLTLQTRLIAGHLLPLWRHHLAIERLDDARRELVTREHGGPLRAWKHTIRVEPIDARRCRYTDRVEISAGLLTPAAWCIAWVFFGHRQRRLRRLARRWATADV